MRLVLGAWLVLGIVTACGDNPSHPKSATATGGHDATGGAAHGGLAGETAQGGKTNANTGGSSHADAGAGAVGGASDEPEGGAAGSDSAGGGALGGGSGHPTSGGSKPMFPCASDNDADEPELAAVCAPGSDFILGMPLSVDAGNAARLIAVTPDELSIVWASFGSSSELYFVADRENVDDAFDAPAPILSAGPVAGMSPDGLRVVTLASDGHSYAEMTRSARHADFGGEAAGAFALLNARATSADLAYADAVISADDRTLVYTAFESRNSGAAILISKRTDDGPWPTGAPVTGCEFEAHGAIVRRPTGIASDSLTLFFYDPDRGFARAAWRASLDAPFTFFRDLPGVGLVAPVAACDKLYYSGSVGQTPLMVAKNGH